MSIADRLLARLRLPVICSPLFIISNPDLVIAQCKAGVVGSFPSLNARPISMLDEWLHRITEELAAWDRDHPDLPSAPFAVNQIVHKTNDRLERDLELCAKYKVPLIITSLGARPDLNKAVHDWGGVVFHDIIDCRFARKAIDKGADGLIAVASGAGGHAGRLSPFALVQELRRWFDGPLALSGAIANGASILAAQAMGADFAYVGSLFIATEEANAVEGYKRSVVAYAAADIVYSDLFTGVHGNYLGPSIRAAGLDPNALPPSDPSTMNFGSGGLSEAKVWKDIWGCGQGIGAVDAILSASEHIARLKQEYRLAKAALDRAVSTLPVAEHEPTVIAGRRLRTHAEIRSRAARAAAGLRELGIGEGDTVALLLRNDFAFFEATQAANLAGAYPVPLNWHATPEEVSYILGDCAAKAIIIHVDLLERIRDHLPAAMSVIAVPVAAETASAYGVHSGTAIPEGCVVWDSWLACHEPIVDPAPATRAAVIYTSGTTGHPKGVKRAASKDNIFLLGALTAYGLGAAHAKVLMNGPMYHTAPNSYAMLALATGADIVLQPRFDPEDLLRLIEQHSVTHMHIVPTMFVRLLRLPLQTRRRFDLSSLTHVVHGAAPCPVEVKRAMIDWWGPIIHEYYGSTETGLISASTSEEALSRPGTVGRPLPHVTVRVLNDELEPVAPGELGDIYIRSPVTELFSYIGREGVDDKDGFITLGDIGCMDQDGFIFIRDRRRDMIISGGVNIYPAEVERVLLTMEGVHDCAVFGIPDDEFGESVCAHVQPVEGIHIEADSVRTFAMGKLSRFKVPKTVKIVASLPRQDSGKIFKRKLRDVYWAGRDRAI